MRIPMHPGFLLISCFFCVFLASPVLEDKFFNTTTQENLAYEYTLRNISSFEIQLIRTSILNKTLPVPTSYTINVIRQDTGATVINASSFGFLSTPAPFNISEMTREQILNFTSLGLKYLINISRPHDPFSYLIRACLETCVDTAIEPCLVATEIGDARTSCQGNGACLTKDKKCVCDHIDWQSQISELPPALKWIAEFLGQAESLFDSIMWSGPCIASPDVTKVIENLKFSLIIFVSATAGVFIIVIGIIICLCCCCCKRSGCCKKKSEDQGDYMAITQDDYDLDATVDLYNQ